MSTLLEKTSELLKQKSLTLSTAESCTGGLLGAAITDLAGSSAFFMGGIIAYDNRIKISLLNVPQVTLQQCGAVSSETVIAMARGIQMLFGTDCALSTSGIAGPAGSTPDKPVGLVYIGVALKESVQSFECHFDGDRKRIREKTVEIAILKLFEAVTSSDVPNKSSP